MLYRFLHLLREMFFLSKKLLILAAINLALLLIGMFLDGGAALFIVVPVLMTIGKEIRMDPVHFGVMICFNFIGIITPPMGIGIFVAARVAKLTPEVVLRRVLPFFIPLIGGLLMISLIPQLTLWLPNLVFGAPP